MEEETLFIQLVIIEDAVASRFFLLLSAVMDFFLVEIQKKKMSSDVLSIRLIF